MNSISFNPCFSGTRARTRATVIWKGRGSEFQSLFFWNSRPDFGPQTVVAYGRCVSILVFLELAPGLHVTDREGAILYCFNPCFSGTRARTEGRYNDAVVSV